MSTDLNTEHVIMWFDDFDTDNEYAFLSNFYESRMRALGIVWLTGEHLFQAMKFLTTDYDHFWAISRAETPARAKTMGRTRRRVLRPDWEAVKYDVMAAVVRIKFGDNFLGTRLLDTGDAALVEGTYWGDEVWGVDLNNPDRPGRNWLGTLLMARRAELRAGLDHDTLEDNLQFACARTT